MPRGLAAGYDWPAYSVHRGRLHMLLYDELLDLLLEVRKETDR